jgi:hypothetical protein
MKTNEFPKVEMPTATKYTLKQELDMDKERWMLFPLSSGIAHYTVHLLDRLKKEK